MNRYAERRSFRDARAATKRYAGPRVAMLTATALLAGGLAGCGNGTAASPATGMSTGPAPVTIPTAGNTPTSATNATTTSAGFDVLANMPDAAKQHTNAGAKAFVTYYVDAVGRLLMNPGKGQLTKLYLPSCSECEVTEKLIGENADAGRRWADTYFRTVSVGEADVSGESVDAATVTDLHIFSLCTNTPVLVHERNGASMTHTKSSDVLIQFWLTWRDGQWFVSRFQDDDYTPPKS